MKQRGVFDGAMRREYEQHGLFTVQKRLKSPLNYIGGKYKLLNQILPLFPKNIGTFVDLFAGGCNVALNITANKIICNDNLTYLIKLYEHLQSIDFEQTITYIKNRIAQYDLSLTNDAGYLALRKEYNTNQNHLDLFVLIAYSFNHQIRFNSKHEYNSPFGKERSSFNSNMKQNLKYFVDKIRSNTFIFTIGNFQNFDIYNLSTQDFVYCDPPYLISTGTYNDGKRGFTGWNKRQELSLLNMLDTLNAQDIKFALSNVIEHKNSYNNILIDWIHRQGYFVHRLNADYSNSNYQFLYKNNRTVEVLITNY